jgi:hypothetical protein
MPARDFAPSALTDDDLDLVAMESAEGHHTLQTCIPMAQNTENGLLLDAGAKADASLDFRRYTTNDREQIATLVAEIEEMDDLLNKRIDTGAELKNSAVLGTPGLESNPALMAENPLNSSDVQRPSEIVASVPDDMVPMAALSQMRHTIGQELLEMKSKYSDLEAENMMLRQAQHRTKTSFNLENGPDRLVDREEARDLQLRMSRVQLELGSLQEQNNVLRTENKRMIQQEISLKQAIDSQHHIHQDNNLDESARRGLLEFIDTHCREFESWQMSSTNSYEEQTRKDLADDMKKPLVELGILLRRKESKSRPSTRKVLVSLTSSFNAMLRNLHAVLEDRDQMKILLDGAQKELRSGRLETEKTISELITANNEQLLRLKREKMNAQDHLSNTLWPSVRTQRRAPRSKSVFCKIPSLYWRRG